MKNRFNFFNSYIDKNIYNINNFTQENITYWLELEYILIDNDFKVVPQSANKFLKTNNQKIISWESGTFQLEISSDYYTFLPGSSDKLIENILNGKLIINNYSLKEWLNCVSVWLPPFIDYEFDKKIEYLNQDDKYKIEREYWLKNRNDKYILNLYWDKYFEILDSCANLALVNWIHVNIKLRNIKEFINFHNIWISVMPFLYWLSSNASFLNWIIIGKKDARLNIWLLSDNFIKNNLWDWLVPYISDIRDYFNLLNSFDYDFDYIISKDNLRNSFELKRESCWFFQQFKILDSWELLYEYRPLTMQITSISSIYLWLFSILTILYFINNVDEIELNNFEDVNLFMKEASDKWVNWKIKLFNNFEISDVKVIYDKYKNYVINFWINNWYISDNEWKLIILYLNNKVSWIYDINDYNSLKDYINISKE